jgi:CRP-like cAMP-binding protein
MTTTADALREIPLFRGMSDTTLQTVAEIAREESFQAGTALVREGDPGDSFMVIRDGTASVEQGGRWLRDLSAGDFLGEIALLDGGMRTATVTAREPVDVLVIDRSGFTRLMDDIPVIRFDIVSALTQRVRASASDALD